MKYLKIGGERMADVEFLPHSLQDSITIRRLLNSLKFWKYCEPDYTSFWCIPNLLVLKNIAVEAILESSHYPSVCFF